MAQAFGRFTSSVLLPAVRDDLDVSNSVAGLFATLTFGVAQLTSPQVGGLLADLTGSFTIVFLLSSAVALLGAVASSMLPKPGAVVVPPRS